MNRIYLILLITIGLSNILSAQSYNRVKNNEVQAKVKKYTSLLNKARTLISEHKFKEAKEILIDLQSKKDIDIVGCAIKSEISNQLGVSYYFLDDYLKAFIIWKEETLPLRNNCNSVDPERTAQTLYNIGYTYKIFGYLNKSLEYLDQSFDILITNNLIFKKKYINRYIKQYSTSSEIGDYNQAEGYLFSALSIIDSLKLSETKLAGILYAKIGSNFIDKREYKKANQYLNISRRILMNKNSNDLAVTYRYIAILNYKQEKFNNASKWINKAYLYYKNKGIKSKIILSRLYEIHGLSLSLGGQPEEALDLYFKTLKIKKENNQSLSNIYENISGAYGRLNKLDSALYYIDLSMNAAHSLNNIELPEKYHSLRKNDFSKKGMIRKLQMRAKYLNRKYNNSNDPEFLIRAEKSFSKADSLVFQLRKDILDKNSKIILGIDLDTIYKYAIDNAYTLWKVTKDNKYKERTYYYSAQNKAAVFTEAKEELDAVWNLLTPELRSKYLYINDELKSNLYKKQYAVLKNDSIIYRDLNTEYLTLSAQKEKLLKEINSTTPEFFKRSNRIIQYLDIDYLQSKLEDDNAILEYYIDGQNLYTFAISKNNFFLEKVNTKLNLDSLFINFYDILWIFRNTGAIAESSKTVYPILFSEKLTDFLKQESVKRLIVIRDKSMNKITFAPILTGSDFRNDFLINKYSFSYAFNNKYIWDSENAIKNNKYTFGGFTTTYDQETLLELNKDTIFWERSRPPNLLELKQSQLEVSSIAKIFDSQTWIGDDCSVENFKKHASDYKIIHLSLHSVLADGNNEQSALIFQKQKNNENFVIKSEDLLNIRFNNYLTVLSSCSTSDGAVIPTEGIKSIARSLFLSGSPSIIATQWHSYEGQTAHIYELFYKNIKKGYSKDVALQKAQQEFIKTTDSEFLAPTNWGNFTLLGDTTKLPIKNTKKHLILFLIFIFILMISIFLYRKKKNKQRYEKMKSQFY